MPLFNPATTIKFPVASKVNASTVAVSATSVAFAAANTSRQGLSVWNGGSSTLYLEMGATASLTAFTVKLSPESYYELPCDYTGPIAGIWDVAGTGSALVREYVL